MQGEIIEALAEANKPLSRNEIAKKLKVNDVIKISKALNKLLRYNEIFAVEIDKETAYEHYKSKRRLRLYFVVG